MDADGQSRFHLLDRLSTASKRAESNSYRLPAEHAQATTSALALVERLTSRPIHLLATSRDVTPRSEVIPDWVYAREDGANSVALETIPGQLVSAAFLEEAASSVERLGTVEWEVGPVRDWSSETAMPPPLANGDVERSIAELLDLVEQELDRVQTKIATKLGPFEPDPSALRTVRSLYEDLTSARGRLRAAEAERFARDTEESAEAARSAAGRTSETVSEQFFLEFARARSIEAWVWRSIAFGLLGLSFVLALQHLPDDESTAQLVRRAAIGIPLLAATSAAFFEASVCRNQTLWAKHVAMQLATVRAYCRDLDSSDQSQVRRRLGIAVFGGAPVFRGDRRRAATVSEAVDRAAQP